MGANPSLPPIRNLLHLESCEHLRSPQRIEVQLFKVMLEDYVAVEPGKEFFFTTSSEYQAERAPGCFHFPFFEEECNCQDFLKALRV